MRKFLVLHLLSAAVLLTACADEEQKTIDGYVEGEYVYLSVPQAGYLENLAVARGEHVKAGKAVFSLTSDPENYGLVEAQAREKSTKARVENLIEPRRVQESASLDSQLSAAETAQVNALQHQMETYKFSVGHKSEVNSAEADLEAAHAVVSQKKWALDKKAISAPTEGEIFDTYYRIGEWVPAGQPVASLLPDNGRKLRFFVSETLLSTLTLGQKIQANCDGCSSQIRATIDYISPQAEYTPPIIYTQNNREKLVFRVEASVAPEQIKSVHPGLPVDISLSGG